MASAEKLSTDKAEDTNTLTKRETKFSEKGHVHFEETCMKYKKPLFRSWKVIEDFILSIQQTDKNIDHYRELESQINSAFSDYQRHTEDYLSFLRQYNSELTRNERQRCADDFDKGKSVVQKALNNIKKLKLDLLDSVSNVSISSSEKKRRGERKLELMKKEAELKKEKLRLEVEESIQKAELKRKKEELEIDLKLLKQESIIEAASDEESVEDLQLDEETSSQRASKYVSSLPDEIPSEIPNQPNVDSSKQKTVHAVGSDSQTMMSEMSLFLMRKQLLPERFSNFEDTPESYTAWKSSFKNIIGELKASAYEELELLINKLTGNSKQAASGIRNANPGKPKHALGLIWERLDHMYGRPEMVEASIRQQLENFQPVKSGENKRLYDLLNILIKIESLMTNSVFASSLAYFNSSTGVNPIITKLPFNLQEKWITRASTYKKTNSVPFPPFTYFVAFIREISEVRNDPAFSFISSRQSTVNKRQVHAKKSDVTNSVSHLQIRCPYHKANHSIHDCKAFRAKPLTERRNFLQSKNICTRCCVSARHCARDCQVNIQCKTCGRNNHTTALHLDKASSASASVHGGEGIRNSFAQPKASGHGKENLPPLPKESKDTDSFVTSMCTTFCGDIFQGRSCSKTFLVDVYHHDNPNNVLRVYAIVDDQCNQTLASPELLDTLDTSSIPTKFTLATCSGKTAMYGRNVLGLKVRSIDRTVTLDLPSVLECEDIPNDVSEIPTPEIAKSYTHLSVIASKIPEFDPNSKIHLLIGRDLLEAHHIKEQILGPRGAPFAQRLAQFHGDDVFLKTPEDDRIGLSVEDRQFLKLMEKSFTKNSEGLWTAPLPFRQSPVNMPNNRSQAVHRAQILHISLQRDSVKKEQFVKFMDKVLKSGAAEVAPNSTSYACWYLPLFGVSNPKKPNQIRGVFDSSAKYGGVSPNSMLMTGPDMINSLLGILLRFRKDEVAMTTDIEQMFYRFRVDENHRDFLRFLWYRDNNPEEDLIE
ncbi:uncharacterized protein LOC134269543 [Saccostrea cucullata]|uniref:uncharacterized protein LOC134269543 n=1 Tax=Saccostrea cuccullata TaxID=36930 RepID=UPI002ED160EB